MSDSQGGPGIRGSRGDRGEPGLTVKYTYALCIPYAGPPRVVIISQKNRHQTRAQNVEIHTMHVPLCCFWSVQVSESHPRSGFSESLLCLFVSLCPTVVSSTVKSLQMCVCVHSQNTSCFCPNKAMLGQT